MTLPKTLFHYTSLDALALILKNRTIRFTRLDRVDDPQEKRTADSRNLAKFRYVSCWTAFAEESIPMWREYAGVEAGVRIELPANPFSRYKVEGEDLSRVGGLLIEGSPGDVWLRFPLSELWDNGFFVSEAICSADILHEVIYTDDLNQLFPRVIEQGLGGKLCANMGAVGVAKATAWSYQREWRYVLTIYPFDIKRVIESQAETLSEIVEAILDRREPDLPPSFDMGISDEAFGKMGITVSPAISEGSWTILHALLEKYNPSALVKKSNIEL